MCLAQGPQRSDAGEARTRGPSVSSQALYHWATALPSVEYNKWPYCIVISEDALVDTVRVSNGLDPDQDQHFVGPVLGPKCLQG